MRKPNIGIIGGGAVGSYFAIKLCSVGYEPILITRTCTQKQNAILISQGGQTIRATINQDKDIKKEYDILVIAVKAYSLGTAITDYQKLINRSRYIILVQSNVKLIKETLKLDYDKVFLCPILFSVVGNYRSIVYELNEGSMILGTFNKDKNDALYIKQVLDEIAPTLLSTNISFDLFLKVIINTALFPLAIITCSSFGAVYKSENNLKFAANIFSECIKLAQKSYAPNECYILGKALETITYDESLLILRELANNKYAHVVPSVLFDILSNKKETELPCFFDDIINMGRENGLEMPKLNYAYKQILDILNNNIPLQQSNIKLMNLNS